MFLQKYINAWLVEVMKVTLFFYDMGHPWYTLMYFFTHYTQQNKKNLKILKEWYRNELGLNSVILRFFNFKYLQVQIITVQIHRWGIGHQLKVPQTHCFKYSFYFSNSFWIWFTRQEKVFAANTIRLDMFELDCGWEGRGEGKGGSVRGGWDTTRLYSVK